MQSLEICAHDLSLAEQIRGFLSLTDGGTPGPWAMVGRAGYQKSVEPLFTAVISYNQRIPELLNSN